MAYAIDADLRYDERTLPAVWRNQVEAQGTAPCVWFPGRSWQSWLEMDDRVRGAASRLADRGLRQGDRVCLLMENSPEMMVALLAIWRLGMVAVPLTAQLIGQLLEDRLRSIRPAAVIVDAARTEALRAALDEIDHPVFVNDPGSTADDVLEPDPSSSPPSSLDEVTVAPSDPALILFTSGSTGVAKGCVLSHHYSVYYAWVFWRYMEYRSDDTLHTCLPLNHCHALFASWWPSVLAGGRLALGARFSPSRYWREIAESRSTVCSAIGMMTSILLSQPADEWESQIHVRLAHVSAEGAATMPEFERRFRMRTVTSRYGSTEAMVFPPLLDMPPMAGLIGPAPADFDVGLVDSDGRDVGDETGELVIRPRIAHTMFNGYHAMPEATLKAFDGLWFHTGDLVRRDAVGMYWFVGRANDTIRRRGENVSAWEVERALSEHPAIEQIAAIPIPSELNGEDIGVVVVPRKGGELTIETVAAFGEQSLPRYMRPDHIWIRTESLPTTATDKVDKAPLREMYAPSTSGA